MELYAIEGNTQRLDGGSMFGNAPRELWKRWLEPDDLNRIPLACRALLVVTNDKRRILFDVGIGAFFEPKLRERYGVVENEHVLLNNLDTIGISPDDITDIVLSHLHFDHAGGLLAAYDGRASKLAFPNANFYVGKRHWERSKKPHLRERVSFIPELHQLLEDSGRLTLVENNQEPTLPDFISFTFVDGHTVGSMMSTLQLSSAPLVFVADLIPGLPWMHLPITMGFDRFPELLVQEKQALLEDLLEKKGRVFFTHDPNTACATVNRNEKGRFYGEAIDL